MENGNTQARKVIVIADPTRESATALQYALSHAILENDKLILLHVENPNSWKNKIPLFKKSTSGVNLVSVTAAAASSIDGMGEMDFLEEMKLACEIAHPKVQVHTDKVEMDGQEKAELILSRSLDYDADLLIVGQRRKLSTAILGKQKRSGSFRGLDTAEYLIENSKRTCVAVQKKGQNSGYLLNTKTQKNFWLLA